MDHSVDLQVGWEFTQSYSIFTGTTVYYWKLRFYPYGLFSITLHPSFKADRLYALELTGNVDEIKSYVFAEFLYFVDRTVCFNFGWYTTKILMTVKIAMSFKDCYKNIWYTLLDYSNWYGPTAKWIDTCDSSNDEDVTLYAYQPVASQTGYFYGDGTKTKACWPGKLFIP